MTQRSILCALFLMLVQLLPAQTIFYQYAFSTEPFTALTNPTVLPATVWDTEDRLPIGFSFKLGNKIIDSLDLSPFEGSLFSNYDFSESDTLQGIFAYNTEAGLAFKAGARISYKTEGAVPNRICKVEWYKVGLETGSGEVSFQFWLYETSNKIQIKLGGQTVPDPSSTFYNHISPLTGLGINIVPASGDNLKIGYSQWIEGTPQAPTDTILYNKIYNGAPLQGCTGIPLENSVFTFTPGNSSALHPSPMVESLQFSPNPATSVVYFTELLQNATVEIVDMLGRTVLSQTLPAGSQHLDLPAGLAPGAYVLRRVQEGKVAVGKLVVE